VKKELTHSSECETLKERKRKRAWIGQALPGKKKEKSLDRPSPSLSEMQHPQKILFR
jgi:hypothetical protein